MKNFNYLSKLLILRFMIIVFYNQKLEKIFEQEDIR